MVNKLGRKAASGAARRAPVLVALALAALPGAGRAHGGGDVATAVPAPPAVAVAAPLAPPPAEVADLKFAELFRSPVGPRGLEPSERLLSLVGRQVRLVGYMAHAGQAVPGRLILTPLPVELGDEDEALADDLPPSAVFVHLSGSAAQARLPNYRGLLQLQGRLELGPQAEPDGHVSTVRLLLDAALSHALTPAAVSAARPPVDWRFR